MTFRILSENIIDYHLIKIKKLEHMSTCAKVIFLENDDPHLSFLMAFKTPALDNRGVSHLLEHLLLRNSNKFTSNAYYNFLKDNVYSYLDASTYWDKTIYAVSTHQKKALYSIIDFYINATLFPNFNSSNEINEIFLEECYSIKKYGGFSGRVYEEMKSKQHNLNYLIDSYIYSELMKGTIYANNPGGNLNEIIKVSLQDCISYHQKYYSPSNCHIIVYGKVEQEELLNKFDTYFNLFYRNEYFPLDINHVIESSKTENIVYDLNFSNKNVISINWLVPIGQDTKNILKFYIIEKIFKNNETRFLEKLNFIGFQIRKKLFFMFDHSTYFPTFEIRLIVDSQLEENIKKILNILKRVIKELECYVTQKDIKIFVDNFLEDYKNKINKVSYSKGLILSLDLVSSWLQHGYNVEILDSYKFLQNITKKDIFELIENFLIKNKNTIILFK